MRANREAQVIVHDFDFYDSGILGILPAPTFNIFAILRRWVWRSVEVGDPVSRQLRREGKLATKMAQSQIAEYLDQTRKNINGYIKIMKELGWVEVLPNPDGGVAVYILGEVHKEQEFFYADRWMQVLGDQLKDAAKAYKPNGRIIDLPWDTRREICRNHIASTSGFADASDDQELQEKQPIPKLRLLA